MIIAQPFHKECGGMASVQLVGKPSTSKYVSCLARLLFWILATSGFLLLVAMASNLVAYAKKTCCTKLKALEAVAIASASTYASCASVICCKAGFQKTLYSRKTTLEIVAGRNPMPPHMQHKISKSIL